MTIYIYLLLSKIGFILVSIFMLWAIDLKLRAFQKMIKAAISGLANEFCRKNRRHLRILAF